LCEKSYNSSRKGWYYGIKLHVSGTAQHDLPIAKQILQDHMPLKQGRLFADKAYIDAAWNISLKNNHVIELFTPRKKGKEDSLVSGDTFSTFVSSVRQPIEYFFNWFNRLTAIQNAKQLIQEGKIDSIKVITALEESLSIDLIER